MALAGGPGARKVSFPEPARFSVSLPVWGAPSAGSANPTSALSPPLRLWQGTCAALGLSLPDGEAGNDGTASV